MATSDASGPSALVSQFVYERTLNQDQAGRRTSLYGQIQGRPALLVLERAPFPAAVDWLRTVAHRLRAVHNLGANDVYHWYMAGGPTTDEAENRDLKINLIWPCTETHVKKYSRQGLRYVTETPALYRDRVRPFMAAQRGQGRLDWVDNILEGRTEVEDVVYRTPVGQADAAAAPAFVLLPDLNWDRRTREALHLLAIVARRDIWSLRDLRRHHLPWLRQLRAALLAGAVQAYPGLARDQLKLYVHYQPTYYHFHVHVVHVQLEAGATQATGKAIALDSLIEQLAHMQGGDDAGMHEVTLGYTLGEASALWVEVFAERQEEKTAEE